MLGNWIVATFSDHEGIPSSKRQFTFILLVACVIGVFMDKDVTALATLAGAILISTEARNIKK